SDMHASRGDDGVALEDQDACDGVVGYNIRDESRDMLIDSLRHGHSHILHDVAGGALMDMQRLFADQDGLRNFFRAIQSLNARVVFLHLITPDAATVESVWTHLELTEQLGELGRHACHIAVLNLLGNRTEQDFPLWYGYTDANGERRGGKTREMLLASGGAE